jgi:hypothetical protein
MEGRLSVAAPAFKRRNAVGQTGAATEGSPYMCDVNRSEYEEAMICFFCSEKKQYVRIPAVKRSQL